MLMKSLIIAVVVSLLMTQGYAQMPGRGQGNTEVSLSIFESDDFSGSGNCAFCHSNRVTDTSQDVSMDRQWRSTMMANSAKDPLWQAKISSEIDRNPGLREVIEDKCSRCHMPMARVQAITDGTSVAVLEEGFLNRTHYLHEAAMDGVSCSICHQINESGLGTPDAFTGNYVVDTSTSVPLRWIYGSFEEPFKNPMQMNVGYTPLHGEHINNSAYCSTCHTLYTPIVDANSNIVGEFPEQTPYLEWEHSGFGAAGENKHCQACHMPESTGRVALSSRPHWLSARDSVGQHLFVGGNSFLLDVFNSYGPELGVTANAAQLELTKDLTTEQLTTQTAELSLLSQGVEDGVFTAILQVNNLAGHKFPTGVPIRRTWLHIRVVDDLGLLLFESGAPLENGRIVGNDADDVAETFEPHYDVITHEDQVQIYETIMYDSQGQITYTFLNAAGYLKDNRILPKGFDKVSADPDISVYGDAADDQNFIGGTDTVTYQFDVSNAHLPVQITAKLLYQSVGYRFMEDLRQDDTTHVARFSGYYDSTDKTPAQIAIIPKEPETTR